VSFEPVTPLAPRTTTNRRFWWHLYRHHRLRLEFDHAGVDLEFFSGTNIKSNFICCLGYGNTASLFPRNPRLSPEEVGRFA
jgi:hypothetical protein